MGKLSLSSKNTKLNIVIMKIPKPHQVAYAIESGIDLIANVKQ